MNSIKINSKKDFLMIKDLRVLLDTNILMLADETGKEEREAIAEFYNNNGVCICDTVFYELLRNLNHKRFQKRSAAIRKCTDIVISENNNRVKATFERLNILYMYFLKKDIKSYLHRHVNDLWIVAAALTEGVGQILTKDDSSDFLPKIFTTKSYKIGKTTVHIKRFNDTEARKYWAEIERDKKIAITLSDGYLKEITIASRGA